MSLILEALKKSEAERQLGKAPGLTTPMPSLQRTRQGARAPLLLVAAVIAVSGALLWWWLQPAISPTAKLEPVAADAATEITSPPARIPDDQATDTQASVEMDTPGEIAGTPPASRADGTRVAPALPIAERNRTEVAATPADPEFESVERESVPIDPSLPAALRADQPADDASRQVTDSAEPPRDPLGVASGDLVRIDQLPGAERDALPPLKQSMHVFAEEASTRFVLIDGRRYGEGDLISPSLRIVEIRRDGTVLEFQLRRLLLPRP
jgi:general secretion pathway protein B